MPAPSIEPAVIASEAKNDISTKPPELVINRLGHPCWCRRVRPPALLVMVALPAVLVPKNAVSPLLMVMVALPAVLASLKNVCAAIGSDGGIAGRARVEEVRAKVAVFDDGGIACHVPAGEA